MPKNPLTDSKKLRCCHCGKLLGMAYGRAKDLEVLASNEDGGTALEIKCDRTDCHKMNYLKMTLENDKKQEYHQDKVAV